MLIDIKSILPSVRTPTLVIHRASDLMVPVAYGRALAKLIPDAKYIEDSDGDHGYRTGEQLTLIGDIEEFVTGHRPEVLDDVERALATVFFTDIVSSTESLVELDDKTWRRLLDSHDRVARQVVERHRGILVKSTAFWPRLMDRVAPFDVR